MMEGERREKDEERGEDVGGKKGKRRGRDKRESVDKK